MQENVRDRVIKLLMLTTSDNDNEALNAIRRANETLKKAGVTWGIMIDKIEFPKSHPPPPQTREAPTQPSQKDAKYVVDPEEVMNMLAYIRANAWPGFDSSFIDSIDENFEIYGKLTWKQGKALQNVFDQVIKHQGRGR